MSTDKLGNENIDMAVGYSNGYKKGYEDGKKDAVKHGHWVRYLAIGWSEAHYTCSCCGYYLHFDRRENANYCPKCGARLDEEEQYYKY